MEVAPSTQHATQMAAESGTGLAAMVTTNRHHTERDLTTAAHNVPVSLTTV